MDKLIFLAIFLLVGATKINGSTVDSSDLEPITPPDIKIEPNFEEQPVPSDQINGRLLTPEEGCGHSTVATPRIVGGGPAAIGLYPWMALLGYKKCNGDFGELVCKNTEASFKCGGSLISSRHVLTATHCLEKDLWFVRLGENHVNTDEETETPHQDIEIVERHPHPRYNIHFMVFDVAVLRLEHDVQFTDYIKPICLPYNSPVQKHKLSGLNSFVAGWGIISEGGVQSSYLKHVQVPIIDNHVCRHILRSYRALQVDVQISDRTVCAGNQEGATSCKGDSGGPLMLPVHDGNGSFPVYQFGIVSWGIPCGKYSTPTVYTSTQYFGEWIQSMMH